jgi:hypothetical protein
MKRNTPAWHALRKGSSGMMPASHWSSPRQERAEQQLRQLIRTLWSGMYVRWEYAVQCASNGDCLRALSERGLLGKKSDSPDENSLAEAYLDLLMMHTEDLVRGEARQLRAALRNERRALLRMTRGLIQKALCIGLGVEAETLLGDEGPIPCAQNFLPQEATAHVGLHIATELLTFEVEAGFTVAQQAVLSQREDRRAGRGAVIQSREQAAPRAERQAAAADGYW